MDRSCLPRKNRNLPFYFCVTALFGKSDIKSLPDPQVKSALCIKNVKAQVFKNIVRTSFREFKQLFCIQGIFAVNLFNCDTFLLRK